jgi:hypothetical protein
MRKWLIATIESSGVETTRNVIIGEYHDTGRNSKYLTKALESVLRERLVESGYKKGYGKLYILRLGKLTFENVYRVHVIGWLNRSGKYTEDGKFVTETTRPMRIERCGEILYRD